ncbi:MAG TPA: HepT-like ribonuclease domain-containing protein [Bacillota bacterium]|nr:HepT-like ribonuclease domain-containing protein [Bacillota bacterium]
MNTWPTTANEGRSSDSFNWSSMRLWTSTLTSPSTGERNIIVHEYETIDDAIVHESVGQTLDLYRKYVAAVLEYLERLPK